jgi:predicted Zn-dependent protease with MMP-like domain
MSTDWNELLRMAEAEVAATLASLPEPLQARASELPLIYEHQPSPALQLDGIEPDTLGLFVGEEYAETGQTLAPMPAQIFLFLDNLWDFSEGDPEVYREEVQATYLHELGHYLGLDELDLDDRGLA